MGAMIVLCEWSSEATQPAGIIICTHLEAQGSFDLTNTAELGVL